MHLSGATLGINKRAHYPHCPRPLVHFSHFDGATGDEPIKSADTAMYRAKTHESGCVFFDSVEEESASA